MTMPTTIRPSRAPVRRTLVAALVAATVLAACGSDGDGDGIELSAAAESGREVYRSSGCSACHGADGQGTGAGPTLQGLYGSETRVVLDGDDAPTTVTADEAYLRQSITDPAAAKTEGFVTVMPSNRLDEADVASIIEYIKAIGPAADGAIGDSD